MLKMLPKYKKTLSCFRKCEIVQICHPANGEWKAAKMVTTGKKGGDISQMRM